ncbi:Transposon Ty3-I Gag-Pol polyprotein [Senna tora]|uniref:Transposon Ty3-I Gag-Pol polyprotein n=1 Tax=Senna tora TaxID=362788 RepID=A0A834SQ77_9FABA|nr:Transposon Ty3-I Gag-Pol polyprotein [Senna tora]
MLLTAWCNTSKEIGMIGLKDIELEMVTIMGGQNFRKQNHQPLGKVEYAIYMLASEAENWWKGARQLMEARGIQLTWENFKIVFFEKYYLVSVRNQKEIKFMQMKHGNMPFEEFIAKYEELSNFSSYLKHNADEAWRDMHVTTALNTTMRNVIYPLDIENYAELVNRCRIVARNIEVAEKLKQGTNFSNKRLMNFSKGRSSKGKKPMVSKSAPNSCPNCGKAHGGRPCLFRSNVCFTCGQTRHYARDCPQKKQTSATHSIINSKCVKELNLSVTTLPVNLSISTPTGECVVTYLVLM